VFTNRRTTQLLGALALLGGGLLVLNVLWVLVFGQINSVWIALDKVLVCVAAAYLISLGLRLNRRANGELRTKTPRIIWGRALIGAWMVLLNVQGIFHPFPNSLKPSSEGEAAGMNIAAIVLSIVGVLLIVSAIQARFEKHIVDEESSKIVL
jgi:hypothetical protein